MREGVGLESVNERGDEIEKWMRKGVGLESVNKRGGEIEKGE